MHVNERECEAAGLDPREVGRLARRISRAAAEAQKMGIHVFGGCSGTLRFHDENGGALILAGLDGSYDGGDGAEMPDADGLMRGEHG